MKSRDADITGKIVVVPKADPGYEWIFTKKIRAFITKYGGAASHMAIRCAEFDIPGRQLAAERRFTMRFPAWIIWNWTAETV